MLGFIVGFASLYGLVRVIRGGRGACGGGHLHGGGWGGHQRGWGGHSHGGHGGGWDGGRGGGDFWLRGISQKLDATPGQEKVIRQAMEDFKAAADAWARTLTWLDVHLP